MLHSGMPHSEHILQAAGCRLQAMKSPVYPESPLSPMYEGAAAKRRWESRVRDPTGRDRISFWVGPSVYLRPPLPLTLSSSVNLQFHHGEVVIRASDPDRRGSMPCRAVPCRAVPSLRLRFLDRTPCKRRERGLASSGSRLLTYDRLGNSWNEWLCLWRDSFAITEPRLRYAGGNTTRESWPSQLCQSCQLHSSLVYSRVRDVRWYRWFWLLVSNRLELYTATTPRDDYYYYYYYYTTTTATTTGLPTCLPRAAWFYGRCMPYARTRIRNRVAKNRSVRLRSTPTQSWDTLIFTIQRFPIGTAGTPIVRTSHARCRPPNIVAIGHRDSW